MEDKKTMELETQLRELCLDGMATYEANIGMAKKPEIKEMNR